MTQRRDYSDYAYIDLIEKEFNINRKTIMVHKHNRKITYKEIYWDWKNRYETIKEAQEKLIDVRATEIKQFFPKNKNPSSSASEFLRTLYSIKDSIPYINQVEKAREILQVLNTVGLKKKQSLASISLAIGRDVGFLNYMMKNTSHKFRLVTSYDEDIKTSIELFEEDYLNKSNIIVDFIDKDFNMVRELFSRICEAKNVMASFKLFNETIRSKPPLDYTYLAIERIDLMCDLLEPKLLGETK